jgi:hypothetical protein
MVSDFFAIAVTLIFLKAAKIYLKTKICKNFSTISTGKVEFYLFLEIRKLLSFIGISFGISRDFLYKIMKI